MGPLKCTFLSTPVTVSTVIEAEGIRLLVNTILTPKSCNYTRKVIETEF